MRLFAKLLQEEHLKEYNADISCPSCGMWFSETHIEFNKFHSCKKESPTVMAWTCGGCSCKSRWNTDAPVMVMIDYEERKTLI